MDQQVMRWLASNGVSAVPSVPTIVAREDDAVFDFHGENGGRFISRRATRGPGAQIEPGTVAGTLYLVAVKFAASQFAAVMRADVLDRVQLAIDVEHRDRYVAVPGDLEFTGE